jgi:hypothetical protein
MSSPFAPDIAAREAATRAGAHLAATTVLMTSLDAGVKYQGLSLEGEYYRRWFSNFTGVNSGVARIHINLEMNF